MHVLILGGTTEASELARAIAHDSRFRVTLSLAGRTNSPAPQPVPIHIGGFGGIDGLADYLRDQEIDALVDATHPFAAQMTRHALAAANATGTALLAIHRPAWVAQPGDRWHVVPGMPQAAAAIGPAARRVMLTIGQQELAPFLAAPHHHYLIRSIDRPTTLPPDAETITARGPFAEPDERHLLAAHRIEVLVTKNAGGSATRAKLDAARALGIEVVIVSRPALPDGLEHVPDAPSAQRWLEAHAARRGE